MFLLDRYEDSNDSYHKCDETEDLSLDASRVFIF